MKIFDKTTNTEIIPKFKSRTKGTDRVIELLLNSKNNVISNIIFGTISRGKINSEILHNITFKNCKFNYVTFGKCENVTFDNCEFKSCDIHGFHNSVLKDSTTYDTYFHNDCETNYGISGTCTFTNNQYIHVFCNIDPNSVLTVINTPSVEKELKNLDEEKKRLEENEKFCEEFCNGNKFGYKIVNAKVLVKLSFPKDAKLVNLDKDKSRANKAKVESIHIINDFDGEGVTNYSYGKPCNYKVGEIAIPDSFDPNPNQNCGHGIHFCINPKHLITYGYITKDDIENLKKKNII